MLRVKCLDFIHFTHFHLVKFLRSLEEFEVCFHSNEACSTAENGMKVL